MKRGKDEIVAKILETCLNGSSKTAIVSKCNMNFKTAMRYIEFLVRNGQIELTDSDPPKYKTTERGKELLALIKGTNEFL